MLELRNRISRPLGTMIAYGFSGGDVGIDLAIASRLGATHLEILPDWQSRPEPAVIYARATDAGFVIHSAHGCWGGQSIRANYVDLAHVDPEIGRASLDDLKRCVDWLAQAGGTCLVIHPGGIADSSLAEARRAVLGERLLVLADHAVGTGVIVCVENLPSGANPGRSTADLAALLRALDRPELALALDTGHAHLVTSVTVETRAAGSLLRTTHVHDNHGSLDVHLPPGMGTIDWPSWVRSLDEVGYEGPIMLECIRYLRRNPESLDENLHALLAAITQGEFGP